MYKGKKIAIVIPAYNEEKHIALVISKIPEYIDRIYVVDDGSTDNTGEIVSEMIKQGQGLTSILKHPQNSGVGKAIVTGYKSCLANGIDISVVMAGDNQMDPMQLPRLLDPIITDEAEYTIGNRMSSVKDMKGMSYWRRFGNLILTWLTRIAALNFSISDPQNGYTAAKRQALASLDLDNIYPRYGYCNDILAKLSAAKIKIKCVAMPSVYGDEKSKIKYWNYIPSVSWLLLKDFFWRIKMSITKRQFSEQTSGLTEV
jgi:glycosyltransferase involved in cell wall biosynthesis